MGLRLDEVLVSDDLEGLLTIQETATRLRISEPYVYKLMKLGELKPIKIGRRTFFSDQIIKDFINSKKSI